MQICMFQKYIYIKSARLTFDGSARDLYTFRDLYIKKKLKRNSQGKESYYTNLKWTQKYCCCFKQRTGKETKLQWSNKNEISGR